MQMPVLCSKDLCFLGSRLCQSITAAKAFSAFLQLLKACTSPLQAASWSAVVMVRHALSDLQGIYKFM